jgi:riboflavin synthase
MFTGIIEEIGSIRKITPIQGGKRIFISAKKIVADLKIGDSVAVCGTCLTVVGCTKDTLALDVLGETLLKTTIRTWRVHKQVNLERAIQATDRFGGHFVQGHINGVGRVIRMVRQGENRYLHLQIPEDLMLYLIPEGSIAVDGVSLTIAELNGTKVGISIIPHTYKSTIISTYKAGYPVNIEVDFLARYLEKLMLIKKTKGKAETISMEWLKNLGYQ